MKHWLTKLRASDLDTDIPTETPETLINTVHDGYYGRMLCSAPQICVNARRSDG